MVKKKKKVDFDWSAYLILLIPNILIITISKAIKSESKVLALKKYASKTYYHFFLIKVSFN